MIGTEQYAALCGNIILATNSDVKEETVKRADDDFYCPVKSCGVLGFFVDNLDDIKSQYNNYICDYSKSMETTKDEKGEDILSSFPATSFYIDNGNYVQLTDWVWKKRSGNNKFSFDSYAEMEWARSLEKLSYQNTDNNQKVVKNKL